MCHTSLWVAAQLSRKWYKKSEIKYDGERIQVHFGLERSMDETGAVEELVIIEYVWWNQLSRCSSTWSGISESWSLCYVSLPIKRRNGIELMEVVDSILDSRWLITTSKHPHLYGPSLHRKRSGGWNAERVPTPGWPNTSTAAAAMIDSGIYQRGEWICLKFIAGLIDKQGASYMKLHILLMTFYDEMPCVDEEDIARKVKE